MKISTIFIITHFPVIVCLLTAFTFVRPSRLKVRAQAIWMMALLLCAAKGIVFETFGGHPMAPSLPQYLVWAWNLAGSFLLILFALSLVWWVKKWRVWILPLLALGLAVWGQYEGIRVPRVVEMELAYPNLPAELDGYRVLQISDPHCSSSAREWRTRAIVELANAQNADLICLTGDYVDGLVSYLGKDLEPLRGLRAKDGVYCVRGNHEYYLDRLPWARWFEENGFRFLTNECVFPRPSLALGGMPDDGAHKKGYDVPPDVGMTFASATNGEFRLLLEHRPVFAATNAQHKVDLQLSGHTHGGIAPLLGTVVKQHNKGYLRGLYQVGDMKLYVSPGAGMWVGFPMRFFDPAEITVFRLRKGNCLNKTAGSDAE